MRRLQLLGGHVVPETEGQRGKASATNEGAERAVGAPARATAARESLALDQVRVFVIAEIRLYREGLCEILGRDDRFEVVGSAAAASSAAALAHEPFAEVVLVSTGLSDNREWIRAIADSVPGAAVVALAVPNVATDVIAWVEAGASAFVTTESSLADLRSTIESARRGEAYCSPRMLAALLKRLGAAPTQGAPTHIETLTAREREIAQMLVSGLSNKEIAAGLRIQVTTVKNHVHNILEKLQVRRRAEAAAMLSRAPSQAGLATGPSPNHRSLSLS